MADPTVWGTSKEFQIHHHFEPPGHNPVDDFKTAPQEELQPDFEKLQPPFELLDPMPGLLGGLDVQGKDDAFIECNGFHKTFRQCHGSIPFLITRENAPRRHPNILPLVPERLKKRGREAQQLFILLRQPYW
jgi:hypothetical protein